MRIGFSQFKISISRSLIGIGAILSVASCSVYRSSYHPSQKYSPDELREDYAIFRGTLEESHPGIYWYTSKDEMNHHFDWGESKLKDSLNEEQFRKVLNYVVARMNCGHTVVRSSRDFIRFRDSLRSRVFPLSIKFWPDTAAVIGNLNSKDSLIRRGTVIKKINNVPLNFILDTLFKYVSSDGYNLTHKYQSLSNRGGFANTYSLVFGRRENFLVNFIDSAGNEKTARISLYDPRRDTTARIAVSRMDRIPRFERRKRILEASRSLSFDSSRTIASMELSSFGRGLKLKRFFRRSFRTMRRSGTHHLIIDVRANGGGSVTNSTLLSRFISNKKFKIADSLYAINRNSRYKRYVNGYFFNQLFMVFMTKKRQDGKFHFGYFERHYFNPKKKNHFDGKVYVVTGGNSFSATTLFANAVRQQPNVFIVGEETGGAAYGNSAWLIPDAILPNTRLRFRLPLFRLVIDKDIPKDGKGVQPEIFSGPTVEAIRLGIDYKMDKVMELIRARQ